MQTVEEGDLANIPLRDVMNIVWRRKWVMVQTFVLVATVGVLTAFLGKPVYSTGARLMVDLSSGPFWAQVDGRSPLAPLMVMRQQGSIESQLAILNSRPFRQRLMAKLPPEVKAADVSLDYKLMPATTIINVKAEGANPRATAAWANVAAQEFVALTDETNKSAITSTREYLERTNAKAERDLVSIERQLLDFAKRTDMAGNESERTVRLQDAMLVEGKARDVSTELVALEAKVSELKLRLAREPETVKESHAQANPEYDNLHTQMATLKGERAVAASLYQPSSAKLKSLDAQIESLQSAISQTKPILTEKFDKPNPERERVATQLKEAELMRDATLASHHQLNGEAMDKTKRVANFVPWQIELAQLQRQRTLAERTYMDFSEKLRDLRVRERAMSASARVLEDASVPSVPFKPDRMRHVGLSFCLALVLGAAMAFLQEHLDDRISTAVDIERVAGLPTIGVVPVLAQGERPLLTNIGMFSTFTESYRALRTSLQYSAVDAPIRTLAVTSAHPKEGKSTTSANLALAITYQDNRVVLIDADMRQPSIHRMFGLESKPGLSDVLVGAISLEEALHETAIKGLKVLTAGALPPNPAELLNSQAMRDLLDRLADEYDLVVIDTPPVLPVTDSQVIAGFVDGMVLVVEAGETRQTAVKRAAELLSQTRCRMLGAVLNKIDQSKKGFNYYYYYRGGYTAYPYAPLDRKGGNGGPGSGNGSSNGSGGSRVPAALALDDPLPPRRSGSPDHFLE
jgi:succinoglycan biosynthesis transport protein ExoP